MTALPKRSRRGFTLMEALLALVLALLLFGGISMYTGTWLSHWERIMTGTSRDDNVAVVLDRVVEDIEAALAIREDRVGGDALVFEGSAEMLSFVRPALGFGPRAGMDRVTYLNGMTGGANAITRQRRDHGRQTSGGEDLPLLRGGPRMRFAYAGPDGEFLDNWPDAQRLPTLVRVEIRGQTPRPWSRLALAIVRAEMSASCGRQDMLQQCADAMRSASGTR